MIQDGHEAILNNALWEGAKDNRLRRERICFSTKQFFISTWNFVHFCRSTIWLVASGSYFVFYFGEAETLKIAHLVNSWKSVEISRKYQFSVFLATISFFICTWQCLGTHFKKPLWKRYWMKNFATGHILKYMYIYIYSTKNGKIYL